MDLDTCMSKEVFQKNSKDRKNVIDLAGNWQILSVERKNNPPPRQRHEKQSILNYVITNALCPKLYSMPISMRHG